MNEILIPLLRKLWAKEISKETFFNLFRISSGFELTSNYTLGQLELAYVNKDEDSIDNLISIGFLLGFSDDFSPILCKLLKTDLHFRHEEIVMILKEFKDPSAVDCLYEAAEMEFDYLEYDDTFQFW